MIKMDMYQKRKIRAEKKKDDSPKSFPSVGINWYPGHMAKTKREIGEKLNLIDLVYEVVDARMPLSSRIEEVDNIIKSKPKIIIMTKYDLCDKAETDKIINYYENLGNDVVPVDLITGANIKKVIAVSEKYQKLENEKRAKKGLKPRGLRVLVLGIPNVGKSTFINTIAGKKKTVVGNKPGVTKQLSWIKVNKDIDLLDTPGILWPKIKDQEQAKKLALFSSIKEEILPKEELAIFALEILSKLYKDRVEERYGVSYTDNDIVEILDTIGTKRGCLERGGIVSYEKVYNVILQDIKNNNFGNITLDRKDS